MSNRKGFSLFEIIVVLIIIASLALIALPNYTNPMTQGAAKAAQNNLINIYNAQRNYYLSPAPAGNGTYYNSPPVANDLPGINAKLGLNINDIYFIYTCATAAGPSFSCTATNIKDANLSLTITSGTPNVPNQIILPGGTNCTAGPWVAPCNPSCTTDVAAYCPS